MLKKKRLSGVKVCENTFASQCIARFVRSAPDERVGDIVQLTNLPNRRGRAQKRG